MKTMATIREKRLDALRYDNRAARYRGQNGRFLSPDTVRDVIENDLEACRGRIESLTAKFANGELEAAQWRDEMAT